MSSMKVSFYGLEKCILILQLIKKKEKKEISILWECKNIVNKNISERSFEDNAIVNRQRGLVWKIRKRWIAHAFLDQDVCQQFPSLCKPEMK